MEKLSKKQRLNNGTATQGTPDGLNQSFASLGDQDWGGLSLIGTPQTFPNPVNHGSTNGFLAVEEELSITPNLPTTCEFEVLVKRRTPFISKAGSRYKLPLEISEDGYDTGKPGKSTTVNKGAMATYKIKQYRLRYAQDSQKDDKQRFIRTGPNSGSDGFMRVEDLVQRLEGDYSKLYAGDWEREVVQPEKGGSGGFWNLSSAKTDGAINKPIKLFDKRGNYTVAPPTSWLADEVRKKTDSQNERVERQFLTYCAVAAHAQQASADGWTVRARFWDKNVPGDPISFVYEVHSRLHKCFAKSIAEAKEGLKFQPNVPEKDQIFGIDKFAQEANYPDYVPLSTHFADLYKVYVLKTDWDRLKALDIALEPRAHPTPDQLQKAHTKLFGHPGISLEDREDGKTIVTKEKISAATAQKIRNPDQMTVMGKTSATAVAEIFWPNENDYSKCAEWLHRSAYSYGGLGEHDVPDDSQVRKNLVFGTYEANTLMIRTESTVKNLTVLEREKSHGCKSVVTTFPLYPRTAAGWMRDLKYGWFTTRLDYTWKMERCQPLAYPIVGKAYFDTFSRQVPTRFELELDEILEYKLYGRTRPRKLAL